MIQTLLTQYSEKPYFIWEKNKLEILAPGIFKIVEFNTGTGGIWDYIFKNKLAVEGWYAIIFDDGYISITHWGCSYTIKFLQENDWVDKHTHNQLCPFKDFIEKYLEGKS